MGNDLITIDAPAMGCSTQSLTPNVLTVLARAFDPVATFTPNEIALIEPIASLVPVPQPADERFIRQSLGGLAAALPSQAADVVQGKLKLNTYHTMLEGADERALAYACRRCLDELDWMPTIHQIKERVADWVSPETAAAARARVILRSGRRAPVEADGDAVSAADLRELRTRTETAARSLARPPAEPVPFGSGAPLEPHQIRIPNKGDYERLFGIDPETEAAKAAAARRADEEADGDLLRAAYDLQVRMFAAA